MNLLIGLLAGIPVGFVLGVACVKLWPGKLTADYVALKGETERIVKSVEVTVTNGLAGVHAKLDAVAKGLHLP
jgi:hypothetical protein